MVYGRMYPRQLSAGAMGSVAIHVVAIGFLLTLVHRPMLPELGTRHHALDVDFAQPIPIPQLKPEPPKLEPQKAQPLRPPLPSPPVAVRTAATATAESMPAADVQTQTVAETVPSSTDPKADSGGLSTATTVVGVPAAYYEGLSKAIAQAVRYPVSALRAGAEGTVRVRFHILRDGTFKDVEILEKSGFAALDLEAVDALRRLYKFAPVPADTDPRATEFLVEIPINFAMSSDQ